METSLEIKAIGARNTDVRQTEERKKKLILMPTFERSAYFMPAMINCAIWENKMGEHI
jgi:hypothetical protein